MRLYLMQHGEAQPEAVSPERELSPQGRLDVERLAGRLGGRGVRAAQARDWNEDTLLAGHQPFMGRLVTVLVAGREDPAVLAFQPGSIACLERNPAGGWEIVWMLRPELLVEPPPEAGSGEWA